MNEHEQRTLERVLERLEQIGDSMGDLRVAVAELTTTVRMHLDQDDKTHEAIQQRLAIVEARQVPLDLVDRVEDLEARDRKIATRATGAGAATGGLLAVLVEGLRHWFGW